MLPMKRQDMDYPGKAECNRINMLAPYVWLGFAVGVPLTIILNAASTGSAVKVAGAVFNAMFWAFVLGIITYVKFTSKVTEYQNTVAEVVSIRHDHGAWLLGVYLPDYDRVIYTTIPGAGSKIWQGKRISIAIELEKRKYFNKVENIRFHSFINTADIATE